MFFVDVKLWLKYRASDRRIGSNSTNAGAFAKTS
jgi:hypothetical protein